MMYLLLLFGLGSVAGGAAPFWEPCDLQCHNNYMRKNDLSQHALIPVCQKGCELLNTAMTANYNIASQQQLQPSIFALPLQTFEIHTQVTHMKTLLDIESKESKNEIMPAKTSKPSTTSPSTKTVAPNPSSNTIKKSSHEEKQLKHEDTSTSKTTVEPTSQPVQDHPVEASKQTTTTNGPRRDASKTDKNDDKNDDKNNDKNDEKVVVVAQTNEAKHIEKHNPNLHHKADSAEKKEKDYKLGKKTGDVFKERLMKAKHTCRHECTTVYLWPTYREACVVGCNLQATKFSLKIDSELEPIMDISPMNPLGMFQRFFFNLAGHVGRLIRISWSWASSSHKPPTHEKPQTFGSEGLTRRTQVPFFIGLRPTFMQEQTENKIDPLKSIREEQNKAFKMLTDQFFHHKPPPFDVSISTGYSHNTPKIITIIKKESSHNKERTNHHHSEEGSPKQDILTKKHHHNDFAKLEEEFSLDNLGITSLHPISTNANRRDNSDQQIQNHLDLLECISRKSGLPRWFIAITIFTSAIVVLWLCFSLTAPPDDIKVVKTKPPVLDTFTGDDDEFDIEEVSCSEKKKLLADSHDLIKIRIEEV